ncbi:FMN-dependent NADH-azoreductase [Bordetella genomosp. 11]|uniref:FMN dependent NADH:quinone oxidoreductase n=1 Tax=Bordetella genomosp. 11 TaxID=1416808 RepID=A0A261UY81_9BORD|nr:NAD(P)H-dependent oxidoreductase [Bordetella genomosp. 11]OZI66856.1 FMN-dependent NADH-azoreductase [Bordetella genomosp. 11]
MNMLVIQSSILGSNSKSRLVAEQLVNRLAQAEPGMTIRTRDLGAAPLPYVDAGHIGALFTPAGERSPEQARLVALADELIAEIVQADRVVIAAPVYNFSIPAQLKTYIDYIARAGVTFQYGPDGKPRGLLTGKKVYVVTARGGKTVGTALDQATSYLSAILGFLGMDDVAFIHAEGLNMGADAAAAGLENARGQIDLHVGELAPA